MQTLIPITLIDAFMLSPKVKHFIFSCEHFPAFTYLPGQFITIHFEREGKLIKRSYSIANIPEQDNRIEFAAGYAEGGPGTDLLFHLKPGDKLSMSGPFGRLVLKDVCPKRYILAATSTGITPYRAMLTQLRHALTANPSTTIVIISGVQRDEELLYKDEFELLAAEFPTQVTFRMQLSRANLADLKDNQHIGYVQHAFTELNLNPAEDIIYLCGNPCMVDEAFQALKDHGFGVQSIVREKYISAPGSK